MSLNVSSFARSTNELEEETLKEFIFKNNSRINLFNSYVETHDQNNKEFRGMHFDILFFDNAVPIHSYVATKKKIYFITDDRQNCWFNFMKMPKGDYKLIRL